MEYRIEKDSLGEVKVPQKALWGAQTQRALDTFTISGIKFAFPFGRSFIEALGIIKFSAASANQKLKLLTAKKAAPIKAVSKDVIKGLYDESFPLVANPYCKESHVLGNFQKHRPRLTSSSPYWPGNRRWRG